MHDYARKVWLFCLITITFLTFLHVTWYEQSCKFKFEVSFYGFTESSSKTLRDLKIRQHFNLFITTAKLNNRNKLQHSSANSTSIYAPSIITVLQWMNVLCTTMHCLLRHYAAVPIRRITGPARPSVCLSCTGSYPNRGGSSKLIDRGSYRVKGAYPMSRARGDNHVNFLEIF